MTPKEFITSLDASFEVNATPELAALRDERRRLLSLVAEILGAFESHCAAPYCRDRNAQVVGEQYEDWRERAGLESGTAGEERTGDGAVSPACEHCGSPLHRDEKDSCWLDADGSDCCPGAVYHQPVERTEDGEPQ